MDRSADLVSRLDSVHAHQLYALLQGIDIPSLKSRYTVDWIDDARTATVRMKYDSGKMKRIDDYEASGTYGLLALYDLLEDFRHTLPWVKSVSKE